MYTRTHARTHYTNKHTHKHANSMSRTISTSVCILIMTRSSSLFHQLAVVIPIVDFIATGNILFWSNAIPCNGGLERFASETNCFEANRVCYATRNKSDS